MTISETQAELAGSNPARRIVGILEGSAMGQVNGNASTLEGWAGVFGAPPKVPPHLRVLWVVQRLATATEQVDLAELRAREAFPQIKRERYSGAMSTLRTVFSPSNLNGSFHSEVRGRLSADVMKALHFLADLLPDDQRDLPVETLDHVRSLIHEAQEALADAGAELPSDLSRYLFRVLRSAQAAVQEYPIGGADALRAAHAQLLSALADYEARMPPSGVAAKAATAIERFVKVTAATLVLINNAGEFADNAGHLVQAVATVRKLAAPVAAELKLAPPPEQKLLGAGAAHAADADAQSRH